MKLGTSGNAELQDGGGAAVVPASQRQSYLPRDLPLTRVLGTATGLQASRQSERPQVGFNIYPPGFRSGGSNHVCGPGKSGDLHTSTKGCHGFPKRHRASLSHF